MPGLRDAATPAQALAQVLAMAGAIDRADARRLLAAAVGCDPGRLTLLGIDDFTAPVIARFQALVARRAGGEPVSHLLGYRDFYQHRFRISADVLDPRPETEVLVRLALAAPFDRVLDLGTGSGAIVLSLLAASGAAQGVGSDISDAALAVARDNAARLGVGARCDLVRANWFDGLAGRFDLIVSNPPYIAADELAALAPELSFEPALALSDGGDGLSAYRAIAAGAGAHLCPGGRLLVEIGPTQGRDVCALFQAAGLGNITLHPDLDGRDRVVAARCGGA